MGWKNYDMIILFILWEIWDFYECNGEVERVNKYWDGV